MSKNVIILFILFIFTLIIPSVSATLSCKNTDFNETNHIMLCDYKNTSTSKVLLSPNLFNNDGLVYSLITKPRVISAGAKYLFKIDIDVYASKEGAHKLTIFQGKERLTLDVNVSLQNKISVDTNIIYPTKTQTINATITFTNNTKRDFPAVLKAINIPKGLEVNLNHKIITLKANKKTEIPIIINYDIYFGEPLIYRLSYGNNKQEIKINLDKSKMLIIEKPNTITSLFSLVENTNSNTIIVIVDIILFITSIILFTMFVGRLGKLIVKK